MNNTLHDEILKEIDALAGQPVLEAGDVTTSELCKLWNVTETTVKNRMKPLIESGEWESEIVYDPRTGRSPRVYRKVAKSAAQQGDAC